MKYRALLIYDKIYPGKQQKDSSISRKISFLLAQRSLKIHQEDFTDKN